MHLPHPLNVICLFVLSIQSFDLEARGWTKWEKLESNIIGLCLGYQGHRDSSPKVDAFVPRVYLVCISYCKGTDHPPEFFKYEMLLPDVAYSDYHDNTKTETGNLGRMRLSG